jgi:hypothetical protein
MSDAVLRPSGPMTLAEAEVLWAIRHRTPIVTGPLARLLDRDEYRCGICRQRIDDPWGAAADAWATIDHIIPRSLGGPVADETNMRPAHFGCNRRRGNHCTEADERVWFEHRRHAGLAPCPTDEASHCQVCGWHFLFAESREAEWSASPVRLVVAGLPCLICWRCGGWTIADAALQARVQVVLEHAARELDMVLPEALR